MANAFGGTTTTGGQGWAQAAHDNVGDFLGINKTYNTIHGDYYDPLEAYGQNMRSRLYGTMSGLWPTIQQNSANAAGAFQSAASAPGFSQAQQLAQHEMAGDYLNGSPALDQAMSAMRTGADASAANTAAGIRSQYARNGMSFGTANQQAQQANQAANTAAANSTEAQARLANYQQERQNQNNAVSTYAAATTTPLNYLAQANELYTQPLGEFAQIIKGLSGGGTVSNPDTAVDNGPMSNLFGAVGSV